MSDKTKIQWTDATWPVVTGCTHISEGCDNCYAARLTGGRLRHLPAYAGLAEKGRFNGKVRLLADRLDWPLRWRKPRKIFVSDMADLFHDDVPDDFIGSVWDVMAQTPRHTYQILTKRHGRMRSLLNRWADDDWTWRRYDGLWCGPVKGPLPNVHLGVSAEDQRWYDIRVPVLLDTPAAVRFVSAEPLLGPIDPALDHECGDPPHWTCPPMPDWLIIGGESGPGARPMRLEWVRELLAQCREPEVKTVPFVKQLGAVLGRELGAGLHGADWDAWPEDLRVREFPGAADRSAA